MNLYKMTIGTSTFYTMKSLFAIEIFVFFQYFFEFIVNFRLFLLKINKFLQFRGRQMTLVTLSNAETDF